MDVPPLSCVYPLQKVGGGADFAGGLPPQKSEGGHTSGNESVLLKCVPPPESVAAQCDLVPDTRGRSLPFTFITSSKSQLVICVAEIGGRRGWSGAQAIKVVTPRIVRAQKEVGVFPGQVAPRRLVSFQLWLTNPRPLRSHDAAAQAVVAVGVS